MKKIYEVDVLADLPYILEIMCRVKIEARSEEEAEEKIKSMSKEDLREFLKNNLLGINEEYDFDHNKVIKKLESGAVDGLWVFERSAEEQSKEE